jgi:tRNA-(ms[2]io[6]A)-hydroxylase
MKKPTATDVARDLVSDLPLLTPTADGWAELARANLGVFLRDHAVCEQQAALTALNLVAHYPEDDRLVDRMTALAAEEIVHLRRVCAVLRRRGLGLSRRRPNRWVRELRSHVESDREPGLKVDRLLVAALVEARSCERFARLLEVLEDEEVRSLLCDLGPAEKRHWQTFHSLAAREVTGRELERRWRRWLEIESEATARRGTAPTVHG